MKRFMIGAAFATFATLLAAPGFAQSYTAAFGTGNMVNEPLAQGTNGRAGVGESAYSGGSGSASAFAYVPNDASAYADAPPRSEPARHSRY